MDADLFRGLLLGLVIVGLIVLAAVLAALSGIRRALEERTSTAADLQPRGQVDAETARAQPAPQQVAPVQETATAAGTPVGGTGQATTIRGVLEQHGLQDSEQAAPAATTATAGETAVQEGAVDSVFAAHADDPQEEPFQRDGRWWFRRGDELLLYDEATGQWQPAPGTEPGSTGAAAAGGTQPMATTTEQAAPGVADQVATYWKCPTCGAVNGSTAATCRMCFAARP